MQKNVTIYDVLISCPSDVEQYIDNIDKTINIFNSLYGKKNNIMLRTIYWSKNAYSEFGAKPQDIINKQLVDRSDMAIAMFWTKFGTPTTNYGSGTEEEFERMIEMDKQVFLYFLDKTLQPSQIDSEEYNKITRFKEKHKNDGLYFNVSDEQELSKTMYTHLVLYFDSIIKGPKIIHKGINKEILWVDDCPENNVYERRLLEQYGFKFTLALSTKQALRFIEQNEYAVIISDMRRQEGVQEGYVLLRSIRELNKEIPFIVYSSSDNRCYKEETKTLGGQGNTNEPEELIELVLKNILGQ